MSSGYACKWLNECAFFKAHGVGEFVDAVFDVDFWDLNVLCEAAWVIVGCVQGVAGCVVAALAVATFVAGNMVGNKDAVADFDTFDFAANFIDDACGFVS